MKFQAYFKGVPAMVLAGLLGSALPVHAKAPIEVVASFSILADMVKSVGADQVNVVSLVPADGNSHEVELTPQDVKKMSSPDTKLLFVNGLGLDSWTDRLLASSGFKGKVIVASDGVKVRKLGEASVDDEHEHDDHGHEGHEHPEQENEQEHEHEHDHGEFDPHAWQDLANGQVYVRNIAQALTQADPENAALYAGNAQDYIKQMQALDEQVRKSMSEIPVERRKIVTTHEAFGYFADAYGLEVIAPLGISTSAEPSAKDISAIIRQIKEQQIPAVFLENVKSNKLQDQISKETGAKVGGILYSDALSKTGEADSYLGMMRSNVRVITEALK
ncbi:metal ABC transporter solute-binding protein, Zn/Mn family [Advenella sp. RU8]|uniref:metal ABC transporter solute-binding protein, Zn/Mn family n=1 Tax=Advenella sp. RU8 TaxID=3399575 RepID=UPI003AAAF4F3